MSQKEIEREQLETLVRSLSLKVAQLESRIEHLEDREEVQPSALYGIYTDY